MTAWRSLLGWLCCALLLVQGAAAASGKDEAGRAPASGHGAAKSCCAPASCHCAPAAVPRTDGAGACHCTDPGAPDREPQAPAPRPPAAIAPEPLPRPAEAPFVVSPSITLAATSGLAIGALPRRSRQEALSVWRC